MALYADSDAAMAPPKGARALAAAGAGLICALMAAAEEAVRFASVKKGQ